MNQGAQNNRNLFSPSSGAQRSEIKVLGGPRVLQGLHWELVTSGFWWLLSFLGLWLHHCNLYLQPARSFPLCASVSLYVFFIRTLVIRSPLQRSFNRVRSHSLVPGIRTRTFLWGGLPRSPLLVPTLLYLHKLLLHAHTCWNPASLPPVEQLRELLVPPFGS